MLSVLIHPEKAMSQAVLPLADLDRLAARLSAPRGPSTDLRLRRWIRLHGDRFATRCLDVAVAGTVLTLLAPLLAVIAVLVRRDGGPALYWQSRVGLNGREFPFPKFRSMVVDADRLRAALEAANEHGSNGVTFKMENDPRITRIGRFLRRMSLDEMPQLWCVLRGDMALVGPRPALPSEVARYTIAQRRRLEAKPGLTCTWQVSGRSQIPFSGQVVMDVEYIRNRSLLGDIGLLFKTVPAVLFGRGAS
jgi:lipopolysaccharide/colanic/teichoic acid biosynthesis glycosyltransferase